MVLFSCVCVHIEAAIGTKLDASKREERISSIRVSVSSSTGYISTAHGARLDSPKNMHHVLVTCRSKCLPQASVYGFMAVGPQNLPHLEPEAFTSHNDTDYRSIDRNKLGEGWVAVRTLGRGQSGLNKSCRPVLLSCIAELTHAIMYFEFLLIDRLP